MLETKGTPEPTIALQAIFENEIYDLSAPGHVSKKTDQDEEKCAFLTANTNTG